MATDPALNILPFGEVSCEAELAKLQGRYQKYYFEDIPFNEIAMNDRIYLIVGRRGSGKSSLAHYFTFQNHQKTSRCIDVRRADLYETVLGRVSKSAGVSSELAIPRISAIWEYIIWNLIFSEFQKSDPTISAACQISGDTKGSPAKMVLELLKGLLKKFLSSPDRQLADDLEDFLSNSLFEKAKDAVVLLTQSEPVIIALDSLERYGEEDPHILSALAGLIQCASDFNMQYSTLGIHVKVFAGAEAFPHLKEKVITNTLKYIRDPLLLSWRSRDLIRLVCWRFYRHLEARNTLLPESKRPIKWGNFEDVLNAMWFPYFGKSLPNGNGVREETVSYLLRHSQLRPRQLVVICNEIAKVSKRKGVFPYFPNEVIVEGVRGAEKELAEEVLNSYAFIYPEVARIIEALTGAPMIFKANLLDKLAPRRAGAWSNGRYSPLRFRAMVADLGVVGRVRRKTIENKFLEADFQYFMTGRLVITEDDVCAIHPMFYKKLNIDTSEGRVVHAFPDHVDF